MALLPATIDYTALDRDAVLSRLRKLVRSVFPEWAEDDVADFGTILVEQFAVIADALIFYLDNRAGEGHWLTATLRSSLLALCKLIGYVPRGLSAATVEVVFTLGAALPGDLPLAKATKVATAEVTGPTRYQLLEEATILAGQTTVTLLLENSEFASESFVSTELASQSLSLRSTPFLDGSAVVTAANGEYTRVDSLLNSAATDRHFVVRVDQNDKGRIVFGDGVNGAIPLGTIAVDYKTGGGVAGRVEAGALTKLEGTFTDVFGNAASISVTNPSRSSGGLDRESNAKIQQMGPIAIQTIKRSVTRPDYEHAALQVPGVVRALMLTASTSDAVPENEGFLFIVPSGGGEPTEALLDAVRAKIDGDGDELPGTNTFEVTVMGAPYRSVDIAVRAYPMNSTVAAANAMKSSIVAAYEAHFEIADDEDVPNPDINFGFYLSGESQDASFAWSSLFNVARDATGVKKIDPAADAFLVDGEREDLTLLPQEFPILGTVTVINALTGETL